MDPTSIPPAEVLLSDPSLRDPGPMLALIREEDPVHWLAGADAWLVTRYDDVRALFSDTRLSADPRFHEQYRPPSPGQAERWLSELPFRSTSSNPRFQGRRLVSAALTPRAVARMAERIAEVVDQFAAPLRGRRDAVDLVGEFAAPVACTVIGRILGVPPKSDDELRFRKLARRATRSINPILSEKQRLKAETALVEICEYVEDHVRKRRDGVRTLGQPEDLVSDLVAASDTEVPSTVEDIVRVVAGLVSAGTGTTSFAAARALRTLLSHPDELATLRADRSLLPNAVEELLRLHSGLVVMPRYVVEGFELRGGKLEKGQLVALCIVAANRDPSVFADPDRLDLRRDTRMALSFGHGAHYCPGSNVARVQLQAMIGAALDFIPPGATLREDHVRWSDRGIMSQIRALPVDFGA